MSDSLTSAQIVESTKRLNYGTWRFQKSWNPLHVVDAEGCYFIDAAGKRYLDFSSQLMCVNLGHKNPAVIKSIEEQARALPYIAPSYASDARAKLSNLLLEVLPKGLEKFFFTTSGTDANEAAFNLAIDEVTAAAHRLIHSLTTSAPPRNREEELRKARERARERFADSGRTV